MRIFKLMTLISFGIIQAQEIDSLLYSKLYEKGMALSKSIDDYLPEK